jgi:hypothetical protein
MRHQAARGQREAKKVGVSRRRDGLEAGSPVSRPLISSIYEQFPRLGQKGQKSRFIVAGKSTGLPDRIGSRHTRHSIKYSRPETLFKKRRAVTHTGADEVTSISYLPATFTTLFFLAAALLLGLIQ